MQGQRSRSDVAARGPRPLSDRPRVPFVGRSDQLETLTSTVAAVPTTGVRVALITGGAGSGKTRLAEELVARVADATTVLWSRATRWGTSTSFGMWVEALDRHLADLPEDEVRTLAGARLPILATFLTSLDGLVATHPARQPRRDEMLHALAGALDRLAALRPVVVVMDDLHLADASTWEALGFVAGRLQAAPLAVVATARPAELRARAATMEITLRLEQEGVLTRIAVPPLDRPQIAELAHEILRRQPAASSTFVPDGLVTWLADRSMGLPLFIAGLLRALVDEGSDLTAPRLDRIPAGLRERVTLELQALDPADRELLEVLAVVGGRSQFPEVARASGLTEEEVAARLERLVRADLVSEHGTAADLRYEIVHPVVQDAIYGGVGGARRAVLHRQAAREMLSVGRLGVAAAHFARAGAPGDDEAIEALCQAFDQSQARGLYQEALVVLEALLNLLPAGDPRWLRVLDALTIGSDWVLSHLVEADADTAVAAMRQLADVLEDADDAHAEAMVQLHLAAFLALGTTRHAEAERACRTAIERFARIGERSGVLIARNELAWIRGGAGDLEALAELATEVYVEATDEGHEHPAMVAAGTAAYGLGLLGRFQPSRRLFSTAISLADAAGNTYREAWARAQHALALGLEGDVEAAIDSVRRAMAADEGAADALAFEDLAHSLWLAGRLEDAVATLARSAARRPVRGSRRRAWGSALSARMYAEMGQRGRARSSLELAAGTYADGHTMAWSFWAEWTTAFLAWLDDDHDGAVRIMTSTADHLAAIGARPYETLVLVDLLEMTADAGHHALVERTAHRLDEATQAMEGGLAESLAALGSAWTYLLDGDHGKAAASADRAVRGLDRGGYRLLVATARSVRGRARERDDREAAVADLQEAADTFEACGAVWRRDRTLSTLRSLGSRGRRAAREIQGPGALSPREREVAQLAAAGHTAREIAQRLFIGVRTVESHLASTYAKLGVASKRELVRRADELGLRQADP